MESILFWGRVDLLYVISNDNVGLQSTACCSIVRRVKLFYDPKCLATFPSGWIK